MAYFMAPYLIGILISWLIITTTELDSFSSPIYPKQPGFFHCSDVAKRIRITREENTTKTHFVRIILCPVEIGILNVQSSCSKGCLNKVVGHEQQDEQSKKGSIRVQKMLKNHQQQSE